jgi:hypothetical protein
MSCAERDMGGDWSCYGELEEMGEGLSQDHYAARRHACHEERGVRKRISREKTDADVQQARSKNAQDISQPRGRGALLWENGLADVPRLMHRGGGQIKWQRSESKAQTRSTCRRAEVRRWKECLKFFYTDCFCLDLEGGEEMSTIRVGSSGATSEPLLLVMERCRADCFYADSMLSTTLLEAVRGHARHARHADGGWRCRKSTRLCSNGHLKVLPLKVEPRIDRSRRPGVSVWQVQSRSPLFTIIEQ